MGALLDLAKRAGSVTEPTKPGSALAEVSESLMAANEGGLLAGILKSTDPEAESRKALALAFLESHANVKRACFAETKADPGHIILTIAVREPWGAVEVRVSRERFDPMALFELSLCYPATALNIPEQ